MKKLILINIIVLSALLENCYSYKRMQTVINTEKPIDNFTILETNYSSGYRGGANILIEFNGKQYYVGVTPRQCKNLNSIKLYYDAERDKVFEQNDYSIRFIVGYAVIYLLSCIWLGNTIYKERKRKQRQALHRPHGRQ